MTKKSAQSRSKNIVAAGDAAAFADKNLGLLPLLHRASQLVESIYARHSGHDGLTARQSAVLAEIAADPKLGQIDICRRTGIDRSTVADIISRLQASGYVERQRAAKDARRNAVTITKRGRSALKASSDAMSAAETQLAKSVGASALLVTTHLLGRLIASPRDPIEPDSA